MMEVIAKLLTRELIVVGGGGEVILDDVTIPFGEIKLVAWNNITPVDKMSAELVGVRPFRVALCPSTSQEIDGTRSAQQREGGRRRRGVASERWCGTRPSATG